MKLTLGQIADWMHAEGDFDASVQVVGYSIDTRTIGAGELFFAVQGEHADGHDYVESALANGAAAAVVSMRWLTPPGVDEARLLRVPDCEGDPVLFALQRLAHRVRAAWSSAGGKRVIGITGSAGKTTTKECIAAVLAAQHTVLKTEGNLNNHLGVPLMLLRLEPEHEVAVLEMGMNHAGEIARLCEIAEPEWGVVSNVGLAHVEFFADGIEGIARAKYELIASLPGDGLAFVNADDVRVRRFGRGFGDDAHSDRGERAVLYGMAEDARVRAIEVDDRGLLGTQFQCVYEGQRCPVEMHLPGRHNVLNALAAIAVGLYAGIPMEQAAAALAALLPTEKRGNRLPWRGAELINDTYNANPAAMQSMIAALVATPAQRRIVIAGEMRELGGEAERQHAACGRFAAQAGVDVLVGVQGYAAAMVEAARAAGMEAVFVESPEEAAAWMRAHLRAGDLVLLKASRGVRLERALALLLAD
jgi:UDP-N-acetylmuramoyl-tripeptide--D-alanyl-D-alanine ligase